MVISQIPKCCIKVVGRTNLGGNGLEAQPLTSALQFLPVDDDPAGNIDQESDFGHIGDHLERQLDLLASQALGAKRYAGHVSSRPRLACNQAKIDGVSK